MMYYHDPVTFWQLQADDARHKQRLAEALLKWPYFIAPHPFICLPYGTITRDEVWQEIHFWRRKRRDCLRRIRQLESQAAS